MDTSQTLSVTGAYVLTIRNGRAKNHNRMEIIAPIQYAFRCKLQPANDDARWMLKWRWDAVRSIDAFNFHPCSHAERGNCDTCPLVQKNLEPGGWLNKTNDDFRIYLTGALEELQRINVSALNKTALDHHTKAMKRIQQALDWLNLSGVTDAKVLP